MVRVSESRSSNYENPFLGIETVWFAEEITNYGGSNYENPFLGIETTQDVTIMRLQYSVQITKIPF